MESEKAQDPSVTCDAQYRRRGRPIGRNRVPLSLNERRARNAQYERERRYETTEAIVELADAAKCNSSISNSELLATVINQLQRAAESDSSREIEKLKRTNEQLIRQVEALEQRLSNWEGNQYNLESEEKNIIGAKRKRKSNKREKPAKVVKSTAGSPLDNIISDPSVKLSLDDEDE